MNLIYGVKDKPKFLQLIVFAFQQLLAILAATIVVPVIINGNAGFTSEDTGKTVQHGNALTFTITLSDGYTQTAPTVKINNVETDAASVVNGVYNFVIANVTETKAVTVESTINKYTVTFKDEDGTVLLAAAEYDYGTSAADIAKPADPTKNATQQYTYTFNGWDQEIADVTDDVVYTATYSSTVNKYTVTFKDEDGTVLLAAAEYDYGTSAADIAKPADPTKNATQQYTYTFNGWDQEGTSRQ